MNEHAELIQREMAKLLADVKFERVAFHRVTLDKSVQLFVENFNLFSTLKPSSDDASEPSATIMLDAYQAPILVCKTATGHYRLVSGLLTFHKLCKMKFGLKDDAMIPCFVLPRRPKSLVLRILLLNDVVRPLLKQFVDVNGSTVTESLHAWFTNDEQPSVFQSPEWQIIFPEIRSKTELCKWLHISTKTVKLR